VPAKIRSAFHNWDRTPTPLINLHRLNTLRRVLVGSRRAIGILKSVTCYSGIPAPYPLVPAPSKWGPQACGTMTRTHCPSQWPLCP
jgi:hypothetical protein